MHILLPTDGSDIALDAAKRGLGVLEAPTKLTLLSVVGDLPADAGAGGIEGPVYTPEQEEELRQSQKQHAEHALDEAEAVVQAVRPGTPIDRRIEIGDPAAMICLLAEQLGVDVVVVGSHGKGFLSRVLLGSVSEHVTRHAPCPVLVVRAARSRNSRSATPDAAGYSISSIRLSRFAISNTRRTGGRTCRIASTVPCRFAFSCAAMNIAMPLESQNVSSARSMMAEPADTVADMIAGSIEIRLAASSSPPIRSTSAAPASETSIHPLTRMGPSSILMASSFTRPARSAFGGAQLLAQARKTAGEQARNVHLADPHPFGDLGLGQVFEEPQPQDRLLPLRE